MCACSACVCDVHREHIVWIVRQWKCARFIELARRVRHMTISEWVSECCQPLELGDASFILPRAHNWHETHLSAKSQSFLFVTRAHMQSIWRYIRNYYYYRVKVWVHSGRAREMTHTHTHVTCDEVRCVHTYVFVRRISLNAWSWRIFF